MINERYKKDLKEIADKLGYEEQSMQLIEEMAELTQAINKYRRYGYEDMRCNIIEEIVDVSIVLEQVAYLLETDMKRLNVTVEEKIERTKKRIAESGKNAELEKQIVERMREIKAGIETRKQVGLETNEIIYSKNDIVTQKAWERLKKENEL